MQFNFVENYGNLSDSEIIELINRGEYELLAVILKRYYPVILHYVSAYCPESIREDAVQEANLALYSAVKDYNSDKSSFSTFASLCIKRSVISVLKAKSLKKNIPDELLSSIEETEIIDSNSPEKIFFERENYRELTDNIRLELSSLEYKVLQFHLSGLKYSDISRQLKISEKAVDNALSRIRRKLKR